MTHYTIQLTMGVKDERGVEAYYFDLLEISIDEILYPSEDTRINQIKVFLVELNADLENKSYVRVVKCLICKVLIPTDIGRTNFSLGELPSSQIAKEVTRYQREKYRDEKNKIFPLLLPEPTFDEDETYDESDVWQFLLIANSNNISILSYNGSPIKLFIKSEYQIFS